MHISDGFIDGTTAAATALFSAAEAGLALRQARRGLAAGRVLRPGPALGRVRGLTGGMEDSARL